MIVAEYIGTPGGERLHNPISGAVEMTKPVLVVSCLMSSYFMVFLILGAYWGPALTYGIYGSLIFSTALAIANRFSRGRPWRAFWIANTALTLFFGGIE